MIFHLLQNKNKVISVLKSIDYLHLCLFIFIFTVAVFSRSYNIWDRTQWFNDSARDITVAKKISDSGQFINIAPKAFLGRGILKNSSVYYNFLAILWKMGGNEKSMLCLFASIGIVSLFFAYQIGTDIGGKWLGLICYLMVVSSSALTQQNISIYQRSMLPIFTLLIIMLAIKTVKSNSLRMLIVLHIALSIAILFHYSIVTFTPVVLVITWKVFIGHRFRLIPKISALFSSAVLNTCLYLATTKTSLKEVFSYIFNMQSQDYFGPERITGENSFIIGNYIFRNVNFRSPLNQLLLVIFCLLATYYVIKHWKKLNPISVLFMFFLSFVITPILSLHIMNPDYMRHYQTIGLILFPICLHVLTTKFFPKFTTTLIILYICTIGIFKYPELVDIYQGNSYLRETASSKYILDETITDYIKSTGDSSLSGYAIIDYTTWAEPQWFTPAFSFFLEKETGKSYSSLSESDNNLVYSFNPNFTNMYLVCNIWCNVKNDWCHAKNYDPLKFMNQECLEPFLNTKIQKYGDIGQFGVSAMLFIDPQNNGLGASVYKITQNNKYISAHFTR